MARVYQRLVDGFAYVAVALLLAIMVAIGLDVGARYIFGNPIGWVFEFVQYSLLGILCFGMAWLTREGGHVAIELLVDALPVRVRRVVLVLATLTAGATSGFIAYWGFLTTIDNFWRGVETIGIYPIPRFLLLAAIALGFGLTAIEFVRRGVALYQGTVGVTAMRKDEPPLEP